MRGSAAVRNVITIKYHNKDPKREKKNFFCKKNSFSLWKDPAAGSFQRENKNFFAKNFCFLSFRVFNKVILYLFRVP
jgi:hypothetical protein